MCKFKVGDKVFHLRHGFGIVTSMDSIDVLPVVVKFHHSKVTFTAEGKWVAEDKFPVLLHAHKAEALMELLCDKEELPPEELDGTVEMWNAVACECIPQEVEHES